MKHTADIGYFVVLVYYPRDGSALVKKFLETILKFKILRFHTLVLEPIPSFYHSPLTFQSCGS